MTTHSPATATQTLNPVAIALAGWKIRADASPEDRRALVVDLRDSEALFLETGSERQRIHRIVQGVVDREPAFGWYVPTMRGDEHRRPR